MPKRRRTAKGQSGPIFAFPIGRILERRYTLGPCIGSGYEGEVYHLTERSTGIERVVKFYYPERTPSPNRPVHLARKLHRLRNCRIILQYHHHGKIRWEGQNVSYVVSELAPGQVLYDLLEEQPRKRFPPFEALHIIHSLAQGVAEVHRLREHHGDIHGYNVLVERYGVGFRLKLIDLYLNPKRTARRSKGDVLDITSLLYELVGGPAGYPQSPQLVKEIVCGRRRQTVFRKFPNAGALCRFMESYSWPEDA